MLLKKWGVLITLSLATFIIVIDTTIMNVSISNLVVDLHTTVTGVQSAISIYALVMAAFMLIGGKLADIFGPKRIFVIGLIIYSVGTTLASFSNSLGMLIIGWSILEGLGAALMIPNLRVLLRAKYDGADRAFAYGIISSVAAVGAAVGPHRGWLLHHLHQLALGLSYGAGDRHHRPDPGADPAARSSAGQAAAL